MLTLKKKTVNPLDAAREDVQGIIGWFFETVAEKVKGFGA